MFTLYETCKRYIFKRRSHPQRSPGDNISLPSSTTGVSLQSSLSLEARSCDDSYTSIGSNQQNQTPRYTPFSLTEEVPTESANLLRPPKQPSLFDSRSTDSNPSEALPVVHCGPQTSDHSESPQTNNSHIPRSVLGTEYQSEVSRLQTFHNWPLTAVIKKEDLAQAGFVYRPTRYKDRVQCAFCGGALKKWQANQRPFDEHAKHFPQCPFVQSPTQPQAVEEGRMTLAFHLPDWEPAISTRLSGSGCELWGNLIERSVNLISGV